MLSLPVVMSDLSSYERPLVSHSAYPKTLVAKEPTCSSCVYAMRISFRGKS